MEFYRQTLQRNGTESSLLPGSASAQSNINNAKAILQATGQQVVLPGDATGSPSVQVLPAQNNNSALPNIEQVPNTVAINPAAGLGTGLMAWVKQNPLTAVGIAVGAVLLFSELSKGGKK